jgi:hypothetical protein
MRRRLAPAFGRLIIKFGKSGNAAKQSKPKPSFHPMSNAWQSKIMSVDLMLPAAEKITLVLEGIGDDKNSREFVEFGSSFDDPGRPGRLVAVAAAVGDDLNSPQINACITSMLLYLLKMRGRRCSNYVMSTRHRAQPGGCQSGAASRRLPSDVRRSL